MDYRAAYETWKRDFVGDAQTQAELAAIANNEAEIEDRFYTELSFGTGGMRGVLGAGVNRMNIYNIRRATAGLADYIRRIEGAAERGVAIAYDSRRMSPEFARETALVLAANGVKAWLFPTLRPVPVLSFAVRHLGTVAGVVITASHNPPQYNGYKVYWEDGAQMPPERADEVLACIRARSYLDSLPMDEAEALDMGLLAYIDAAVDDAYIEQVKTLAIQPELLYNHGGDMKIVYTPLHGSGNVPVRRVLTELGVNVIVVPEQEKPDPDFPTVKGPNPEEPDTFRLAIALADREGADTCFATDPDCDRLGVAMRGPDGGFRLLTGNQIGCLLLHYILTTRERMGTMPDKPAAIKSIVSTELARAIAGQCGVAMLDTLTGFKFIAEEIQRFEDTGSHTFVFGFEESYGYLSSAAVRDKDAVNASLLVTELVLALKMEGKTLWDRMQEIYEQYGYYVERAISVALPGKDGQAQITRIMQTLRENPPTELAGHKVAAIRDFLTGLRTDADCSRLMGFPTSDVLYFEIEGGQWICVRPSGTEPKIKLYISTRAATQAEADALSETIGNAARALLA